MSSSPGPFLGLQCHGRCRTKWAALVSILNPTPRAPEGSHLLPSPHLRAQCDEARGECSLNRPRLSPAVASRPGARPALKTEGLVFSWDRTWADKTSAGAISRVQKAQPPSPAHPGAQAGAQVCARVRHALVKTPLGY